jgi:hypothetical protein
MVVLVLVLARAGWFCVVAVGGCILCHGQLCCRCVAMRFGVPVNEFCCTVYSLLVTHLC